MDKLVALQQWLDTLSPVGIGLLAFVAAFVVLLELLFILSYFSKERWQWIKAMLTNNDNKATNSQPDHADGNFVMIMYTARWLLLLVVGCVVVMWFTPKDMSWPIGELGIMMLACLGIKYVPTLRGGGSIGHAVIEKIEEHHSKKVTTDKKDTERSDNP